MSTYKNIKTLSAQVEHCLRKFPESRNSDITLSIKVWQEFYSDMILDGAVPFGALYQLPREDNVKRVRAKWNEKGLYYPTVWEVAKARGINQDEWRVAMGYPTTQSKPGEATRGDYVPPSLQTPVLTFASKTKPGTTYHVAVADDGIVCDCPSFTHRGQCSHVRQASAEVQAKHQEKLV